MLYSLMFHFNFAAAVSQALWLLWSCLGMARMGLARRQARSTLLNG
ncbi:CBU_0592 family membrane protein [Paraburkholderia domus]